MSTVRERARAAWWQLLIAVVVGGVVVGGAVANYLREDPTPLLVSERTVVGDPVVDLDAGDVVVNVVGSTCTEDGSTIETDGLLTWVPIDPGGGSYHAEPFDPTTPAPFTWTAAVIDGNCEPRQFPDHAPPLAVARMRRLADAGISSTWRIELVIYDRTHGGQQVAVASDPFLIEAPGEGS